MSPLEYAAALAVVVILGLLAYLSAVTSEEED